MKVALVTEVSTSHINGVSKTITKLLDHLIENDHEGIVIGPAGGSYKNKVPLIGTFGLPLFFYPELRLNFALPHMILKLIYFKPDVIHLVDPNLLGPQILLACKLFLPNTPIVSSYHTNIAFYAKMFGFSMLYEPIWATHRLYHGSSKYVLCPSYSTREALSENGIPANKVLVWSRGVDNALFSPLKRNEILRKSWFNNPVSKITSPGPVSMALSSATTSMTKNILNRKNSSASINTPELNMMKFEDEGVAFDNNQNKVVLLYVGRISWEKNLRVLVESFKKMNHDEYHLVIVGDGPAKQTIQNQLEPTGGVTFTGYLKGERLAEAYASADIFAFPSVSETFGQVVLEAQASGLPVVGMQAEGVKEIVADGVSGILVNPNNDEDKVIDDYHNAILQISSDNKTHNSMSKQALMRSQKFTWNAAMETCINAYKNAINQN